MKFTKKNFLIFFCEILRGYEEFLNRNFFNEDFVDIKTLFNCLSLLYKIRGRIAIISGIYFEKHDSEKQ